MTSVSGESNSGGRNRDMGTESGATASPSSSPAASAKRGRDPEDDVYVDNLHSHKRYLSEIMASSLNGLTVGDNMPDNLMDSTLRFESTIPYPYHRDETSVQYSPMSEDSDDSRYYENTCSSQPESAPTSPVSPYRCQKHLNAFVSGHPTTSSTSSPQQRQRGSDTEGRFPSSPSDICHSADLRRAALLRSVQMRTQPLGSSSQFELQQESGSNIVVEVEVEERACSYMKLEVDERSYQIPECTPLSVSESESENGEKSCGTVDMNLKGNESSGE